MANHFPESFTTTRLSAERLQPSHFADILAMHTDPQHMALLGGPRDEAETRAYMQRNLDHWDRHGFGLWLLRLRTDGTVVGRAILRHLLIEGKDEIEVGYGFQPQWWGRGLATEITIACLQQAQAVLGRQSIVALTLPQNVASQRVMAKAGMQKERTVQHAGAPHLLFRFVFRGADG